MMKKKETNVIGKTNPKGSFKYLKYGNTFSLNSSILLLEPKICVPTPSNPIWPPISILQPIKVNKLLLEQKTQLGLLWAAATSLSSQHNPVPIAFGKGKKGRSATVLCGSKGAQGHHFNLLALVLSQSLSLSPSVFLSLISREKRCSSFTKQNKKISIIIFGSAPLKCILLEASLFQIKATLRIFILSSFFLSHYPGMPPLNHHPSSPSHPIFLLLSYFPGLVSFALCHCLWLYFFSAIPNLRPQRLLALMPTNATQGLHAQCQLFKTHNLFQRGNFPQSCVTNHAI